MMHDGKTIRVVFLMAVAFSAVIFFGYLIFQNLVKPKADTNGLTATLVPNSGTIALGETKLIKVYLHRPKIYSSMKLWVNVSGAIDLISVNPDPTAPGSIEGDTDVTPFNVQVKGREAGSGILTVDPQQTFVCVDAGCTQKYFLTGPAQATFTVATGIPVPTPVTLPTNPGTGSAAPQASVTGPTTGTPSQALTFNATFTDPNNDLNPNSTFIYFADDVPAGQHQNNWTQMDVVSGASSTSIGGATTITKQGQITFGKPGTYLVMVAADDNASHRCTGNPTYTDAELAATGQFVSCGTSDSLKVTITDTPPAPAASNPQASVQTTNQASGIVGQPVSFQGFYQDADNDLGVNSMFMFTAPVVAAGQHQDNWTAVPTSLVNTTQNGAVNVYTKQGIFTYTVPGDYYVMVTADDNASHRCTGNPTYTDQELANGKQFVSCGTNDWLKITVTAAGPSCIPEPTCAPGATTCIGGPPLPPPYYYCPRPSPTPTTAPTPIPTSRPQATNTPVPTVVTSACPKKAQGDADCNGVVNNIDYLYYVTIVNGGTVPAGISADFNGDGEVGFKDRQIIIQTLNP